MDECKTA